MPFEKGAVVVAKENVENNVDGGYLSVRSGDILDIEYVGPLASEDEGWLYCRAKASGQKGWLSRDAVEAYATADTTSFTAAVDAAGPVSIELIGSRRPGAGWSYWLQDASLLCFAGYLPGARVLGASGAQDVFNIVMSGMSKPEMGWERPSVQPGQATCGTRWMVRRDGCCCPHRFYGSISAMPVKFPEWMYRILERCMPLCGVTELIDFPDGCSLECYADGDDAVDWHADADVDCQIVSLSLGGRRSFELRHKSSPEAPLRLELGNGDLCTMEGQTQQHYLHRVPKSTNAATSLHVKLNWFWLKTHHASCPVMIV